MSASFNHVMVVDDIPANLRLLKEMLQKIGFSVSVFKSGQDALASLVYALPDIILMDITMPDMDGYEACRRIKATQGCGEIPVIFISALNEVGDKVKAFQNGGVDYITKPFEFEEVKERIYTHLKISRLQKEVGALNQKLSQRVSEQIDEIALVNRRMVAAQNATIMALAKLSECRDTDTGAHLERVGFFCERLAMELGKLPNFPEIDALYISTLKNVAPLHDIGKVGIEDSILLKPGRLTPEEFEVMKRHTQIGANTFLAVKEKSPDIPYAGMAYEVILHHHERYDGTGYPDGLAEADIPLCAQIMALADVYDALRSKRPYKTSMTKEQAEEIIFKSEGTHFAPVLVAAFADCADDFDQIFEQLSDMEV